MHETFWVPSVAQVAVPRLPCFSSSPLCPSGVRLRNGPLYPRARTLENCRFQLEIGKCYRGDELNSRDSERETCPLCSWGKLSARESGCLDRVRCIDYCSYCFENSRAKRIPRVLFNGLSSVRAWIVYQRDSFRGKVFASAMEISDEQRILSARIITENISWKFWLFSMLEINHVCMCVDKVYRYIQGVP